MARKQADETAADTPVGTVAETPAETVAETVADALEETARKEDERRVTVEEGIAESGKAAEEATAQAEAEGRLPASMAVANPEPATELDAASGAFMEPVIRQGIPVEHPSIDNNPRLGTSAVQNGADFNDPNRRDPTDPKFTGQGLDRSVYGKIGE